MIEATCFRCKKELEKPGAILLSDPVYDGAHMIVDKYHLCTSCYRDVLFFLSGYKTSEDDMRRASGDCKCDICGKLYRQHKYDKEWLDYNSEPYLNRLCDGSLVKL